MMRFSSLFIAAASLVIVFLAVPSAGQAAGLPEGVSMEVVAEYASKTPGVEKVLFRRMTLEPGASWTFTVPAQSLCQATKGELEVADQTAGKTYTFKVGDRWDTSPGHKVTLSNKGTVDHEHLFYTMIVKK
jgi:F0F1-type ATP synthase membrane subunit c/vacuolar-type H+-ATPase subunit K